MPLHRRPRSRRDCRRAAGPNRTLCVLRSG